MHKNYGEQKKKIKVRWSHLNDVPVGGDAGNALCHV